jgi:hypothetical protein
MKPHDLDEVNYNGGNCNIGHKVLKDLMKPTVKNQAFLVVSLRGGGNVFLDGTCLFHLHLF